MEKYELIDKTIILLRRLIEQRNYIYPEGYLNLGIAYAARGEYDKSIESIEKKLLHKKVIIILKRVIILGVPYMKVERNLPEQWVYYARL